MKIAVITDVHANLPALSAVLKAIKSEGCELVFHLGDAIAIGPYPAECVDLLSKTPDLKCVLGNHELYYLNGLPEPQPDWMSDGEVRHQKWTHRQLGCQRRTVIAQWPFILEEEFEGVKIVFVHYGLAPSKSEFLGVVHSPKSADLDNIFRGCKAEVLFFGHDHSPSSTAGKVKYINPGSLGCSREALARFVIADIENKRVKIQNCHVRYDDKELFQTFENRNVPERAFIYQTFFGGRFGR